MPAFAAPIPALAALAGKIGAAGGMSAGGAAAGGGMAAMLGPLLSGGMSLFGGLSGQSSEREMFAENLRWQKELARKGIRMRVQDAEQAGIHPLYALGAPPMSSFPVSFEDHMGPALRDAGQNIGGALHRMMDPRERDRHQLDMALGQSQLEESDARRIMYLSQAARNMQEPSSGMPLVNEAQEMEGQDPRIPGTYKIVPPEVEAPKIGNPDTKAGTSRGMEQMEVAPGMYMHIPNTKGESFEEIAKDQNPFTWMGLLLRRGGR